MNPMLSIDFGNTYTKVALRLGVNAASEMVTDRSLEWDDQVYACVPTVAASLDRDGRTTWHFGTDVTRFREDMPGLTVYRNWKPQFFRRESPPVPKVPLGPPERWAAPFGVSAEAWSIIARSTPDKAREIWVQLNGTPIEHTDQEHKSIAAGYFRWLREFFEPTCRNRAARSVGEIPLRISLPSFGSIAGAELLLREMLGEAGWCVDQLKTLPEPLANVIGIFTEGRNATRRDGRKIFADYGQMFRKTGMIERMRASILADGPRTAWVMIADVGGYTTDFAMLGIALDDIDSDLAGERDGRPALWHQSSERGVTDLDKAVMALLPPLKQEALKRVVTDPAQQRLETFHRTCYGRAGRYAAGRLIIGGTTQEQAQLRATVQEFAEGVADDAEKFIERHQYDRIDDLILTGGGTMIPAVREAICNRLSYLHVRYVHALISTGEPKPLAVQHHHQLSAALARGATALGGASIYFDATI